MTRLGIYSGQASQKHNAKTYAANRRQFQSWRNSSDVIAVVTRTLDYSLGHPREKGIDVKLAVDLVRDALVDPDHDAIVVSADTDLLPALELVVEHRGPLAVEVATWEGPNWSPSPLALAGHKIRQHRLTRAVYDVAEDTRDYTIGRKDEGKPGGMGSGGGAAPPGRKNRRALASYCDELRVVDLVFVGHHVRVGSRGRRGIVSDCLTDPGPRHAAQVEQRHAAVPKIVRAKRRDAGYSA